MRLIGSAALTLMVLAAGLAGADDEVLAIGESAPMTSVMMLNVDGEEVSIGGVAGEQGTLVIFSCNHCPWVVAWEDRIAAIGNEYMDRGFGVIAINPNDTVEYPADGYEQMQARAEERGFRFPYVVDATSDVARAFGATRTPEVFLFDGEGLLVYHGAIDDNARQPDQVENHYLRDSLEALLAGEEIAVAETRALGCTIKFRPEE